MKIKMQANELKKVDIEFLSLVSRGANRSPFKVVKAEDAAQPGGMVGAVKKFFAMSEPAPQVVAVFVEKSALETTVPHLAAAGFKIEDWEALDEGAILFKQEGFADCKAVVMVKSEPRVGLAVAHVAKLADTFSGDLSFDPNVSVSGFYPGMNSAIGALQAKLGTIVAEGGDVVTKSQTELKSFSDYITQMLKALPESVWKFESLQRGFGSATVTPNAEVTALIETVVKAAGKGGKEGGAKEEAKLQSADTKGENGNRFSSTTSTTSSEMPGNKDDSPDDEASRSAKMTKAAEAVSSTTTTEETEKKRKEELAKAAAAASSTVSSEEPKKPKVFKDEKGEYMLVKHADGKVCKYTPGAKIPEGATCMTEEWVQDERNGEGNSQGQGKAKSSESADDELHHTGAGGLKKEDIAEMLKSAFTPMADSFKTLSAQVAAQGETLKKQGEQIAAVNKTATEAVTKADRTVVHVQPNYDSARENLGGGALRAQTVRKSAGRVSNVSKAEYPDTMWLGLLGPMERHVVGEGD
jgi:hypothetical protein